MKEKLYLGVIIITLLFTQSLFSQTVLITGIVDGTVANDACSGASGSDPRFIEIYVNGTIDFTDYDLDISVNGGNWVSKDISSLSSISNQFVYIVMSSDITAFDSAFPGVTRITIANETINGNDAVRIEDPNSNVLDVFGDPTQISSSSDYETWNYQNSYAKRKNGTLPNNGVFIESDFSYPGADSLDNLNCSSIATAVNLGSYIAWEGDDVSQPYDWNTNENWSTGSVPLNSDDIVILKGLSNYPTVTTAETVNSLTIASGASLVASNPGFTVTNSATYTRNLANASQWYLISSPVNGESYDDTWVTNNDIPSSSADTGNRGISWYDNSSSDTDSDGASTDDSATGYWRYMEGGSSSSFEVGRGYGLIKSTSGDAEFIGTGIYTSDQTFALTQGDNNFNLVGNPFTAFITLGTFHTTNTANIGTDFYFWNGSSYITRTSSGDSTYEIAPGQGFFIEASSTNNITFEISDASHQGTDTFQKSVTSNEEVIVNVSSNNQSRFARIRYNENASLGYDLGYDGKLFSGVSHAFAIYSDLVESNGKKYQSQFLPNSDYENMVIPIGVIAEANKEIAFSSEASNLPSGINVYLEDRIENTFTQLNEANSEYKITPTEKLNGIGRFYLHTKSSALSNDRVDLNSIRIYKTNATSLRIAGLSQGNSTFKLFNLLGKEVLSTSFSTNGNKDITLPNLASGIYIVQLETESGKLNKKIALE